MNRKERRAQKTHSNTAQRRRGVVTHATATGVLMTSIGFALPANAAPIDSTVTSCADFISALPGLANDGGTLNAHFTGSCILNNSYTLGQASIINGPSSGVLNLVKATGSDALFTATSSITLSNLTFTGESAAGAPFLYEAYGHSGETILNNDVFQNNNSGGGAGAIYVEGHIEINDSKFFSNQGSGGGAVFIEISSQATISNSVFDGNVSDGPGGAVRNSSMDLQISGTTFTGNESTSYDGGAIYSEGSLFVKNSSFFDNSASAAFGGAISAPYYTSDVDNSTFVNNSASDGGAMLSEGGIVSNSTFWNNGVTSHVNNPTAGSISIAGGTFFGNILASSNSTPVIQGGVSDAGANLFTDASFAKTTTGEGASKQVSFASLKLKALALNKTSPSNSGKTKTVALGEGSSAIDFYAATSAGITPTYNNASRLATRDQRGAPRPAGEKYDVGAFEVATAAAITHNTILFHGDSAKLTSHAKNQLRALAKSVQAQGVHSITLDGHTATLTKADPAGRKLRGKIAGARTRAVEKYLKKQFKKSGYSVTITRVIKGAADPVKSNRTEKGRKANRRVYITVK